MGRATERLIDRILFASRWLLPPLPEFRGQDRRGIAGERLSWLMKLDTGAIRVKVLSSIVAISAIDLLKAFFDV